MQFNEINFDALRRVANAASRDEGPISLAGEALSHAVELCELVAAAENADPERDIEALSALARAWALLLDVTAQPFRPLPHRVLQ